MKTKYLQAMGVTSWRLRDQGQMPSLTRYYRLSGGSRSAGLLIATFSPKQLQPEQQLLAAIIQALGMQAEEVQPPNTERSIALGTHSAAVTTHSLADMLKTPSFKAPVWRVLQDFFLWFY